MIHYYKFFSCLSTNKKQDIRKPVTYKTQNFPYSIISMFIPQSGSTKVIEINIIQMQKKSTGKKTKGQRITHNAT